MFRGLRASTRHQQPHRRRLAALATGGALLLTGAACTTPAPPSTPYPRAMASAGDSITRGFDACGPFVDCPGESWSTGLGSDVSSQLTRLTPHSPALAAHAYNDAQTGATTVDLGPQVADAVRQGADYLTVLVGANDVCTPTAASMTSAAVVEQRVVAALRSFTAARPAGHVLLASIPDVYRLWEVAHGNANARFVWGAAGICQSMLGAPASTSAADVARRAAVRTRIVDDNAALARACAAVARCRSDGGAVFRTAFSLSQLSQWDYFHPNGAGQRLLADATWRAGYWA